MLPTNTQWQTIGWTIGVLAVLYRIKVTRDLILGTMA